MTAEPSVDERDRLAAIRRYRILDTLPDGPFDRVTALAAHIFRVPIAVVSIVDADRIWFKSHHGLDVRETTRAPGFCASAILQNEPWVVRDATADPRARRNPLVVGVPGVRFYAGMPLTTRDGHSLGTIGVMDREPREVTDLEREVLRDLAAIVMDQLELRLSQMEKIGAQRRTIQGVQAEVDRVSRLARTLQRSLLPPHLPEIPGLELASEYMPSSSDEVGGDFYDVFPVSSRSWGVVIGDVCGKGPDAAVLTGLARYTLRAAATDTVQPADVLAKVNQIMALRESAREGGFCTLAYSRVRPTKDGARVQVASGGHPLPLVLRANGRVESLGGHGHLVGAFADVAFSSQSKTLLPGDAIVFYTDGVTEARTGDTFFGEDRLVRTVAGCVGASAQEIVERVAAAVGAFGQEISDDIALLALKVLSPRAPSQRA